MSTILLKTSGPDSVDLTPNDPEYSSQDYLPPIDAAAAWNTSTGSISTTIAILDTGVYTIHPDLDGRVVLGLDYVNGDSDPEDDNGHGTAMAGIIGAETNNGLGIAGLDWNAELLILKVADASGNASSDALVQGITDAVDAGADIINISLGSTSASFLVQSAVDYAYTNNVVIIASAGNDKSDIEYYPASFPHVMSVAAVISTGIQADRLWLPALGNNGTNYHYTVDLTAPGTSIYSTLDGGGYGAVDDGTSASAAIVSGVAGLVKAIHPTWTPDQIMGQIAGSSFDNSQTGSNENYLWKIGAGRVDADGAVGPDVVGAIAYAGFELDDPNGDGDGLASPGDLVEINVFLKTYNDLSTGVTGALTTSDAYFSCGSDPVTYPDMAFGVITPSSPLTCTISTSAPIGHSAQFNFMGNGGPSGTVNTSFDVVITPNPKDGWPKDIGLYTLSSPALTDFEGDGWDEIFLSSIDNSLKGWNVTGTVLTGWPQTAIGTHGDPAVADLDRDGNDEVILPGYVFHQDGSPMTGWPVDVPTDPVCSFILAAPAVGDVTGDGFLNIVFGTLDQYLHVYNMDGTPVDGWPKEVGASVFNSVALANLDSDNALEIVVATAPLLALLDIIPIPGLEDLCGVNDGGGIHVFNGDGSYMSGWPQMGFGTNSSPSVGDIDGDGKYEIAVAEMAFEINGNMVTGFSDLIARSVSDSPAIANINGIGAVEIVYAGTPLLNSSSSIYVVDGSNSALPGWPVNTGYNISSSPIVVDLDNDGSLEIVVTAAGDQVLAYDKNGDPFPGFPIVLGEGSSDFGLSSSPAADDADGDGRLDLFVPVGGEFYAWEMDPGSYNSSGMPWPGYNHDLWNTGTYGFVPTPSQGAITINNFAEGTDTTAVTLTLSAPGATQMCISNSTFCSAWVPMAAEYAWTLSSGTGSKTVYATFRYPSGPNSARVSDNIFLDETLPSVAITSPGDGATLLARRSIPVFGTATDNYFERYESSHGAGATPSSWIWMGSGITAIPSPSLVGTLWTDDVPDGTNVLRLIAEDTGGNIGEDLVSINLGRIRDIADTLTPTMITAGEVVTFEVDVTNPMAENLNLNTDTTFWLQDLNPSKASKVPPFNAAGPFSSFTIPIQGVLYAQTFTANQTFFLSQVGIPISLGFGSALDLEIRPVDDAGEPILPALASSTSLGFALGENAEILFDDVNVWIQEGETYAVVLKPTMSLSYLLVSDDTGGLPGAAFEYTVAPPEEQEDWITKTYDLPLQLYQPLAYSATLTADTLLPASGSAGLTFESGAIPLGFGPQLFTPTITYSGTEGVSADFFTFTKSDVNGVGLVGDPPTLTIRSASVTEPVTGTREMYFTAFLSNTSFYNVTVNYTTTNVEAESGLDYVYSTGVLEIPTGQVAGVIPVTILEDDEVEGTETFTLDLGEINHAYLENDQAVGTILRFRHGI